MVDKIFADWRRAPEHEDMAMLLVWALYRCARTVHAEQVWEVTKEFMAKSGHYPSQLAKLVARIAHNEPELLDTSKTPF